MKVTEETLLKDIEIGRNTLQTDKLDMSFGEIMSMYEREEIIINPDFQRLYRWTDYQKTRFIIMQRKNIIVMLMGCEEPIVRGNFKKLCLEFGLPYHSLKTKTFPFSFGGKTIHKVEFK